MIEQEELDQQQMNANKEKLVYSPPMLIVYGTIADTKSGNRGVSEHICGCGIGS